MRSLHLQHFRCYSDLQINFKPGINLLVGDNASGKTALLKACQYVLSAFFAEFKDEGTRWLTFGKEDFQRNVDLSEETIQTKYESVQVAFDPTDLIQGLTPEYSWDDSIPQVLERKKIKDARTLRTGFKSYASYAGWLYDHFYQERERMLPLPLFAYYSVEDIHATRRLDIRALSRRAAGHALGYFYCLDGDGFLPYWVWRLLVLKEREQEREQMREQSRQEIAFVCDSVLRVVGREGCGLFEKILILHREGEVVFVSTDGREIPTGHLSAGQKRVVAMAVDLAFRSYHLNYAHYGASTCKETTGTVLIDEVDMHLHPSLQATLLPALQRAYPRVQFIASSHAPMVMSGIESNDQNAVYRLSYDAEAGYQLMEVKTYGLDLSTLVERLWELPSRAKEVDERLRELFRLIDTDEHDQAQSKLSELKELYPDGELAELARAEIMLRLLH